MEKIQIRHYQVIIIAFLIGITLYSVFKYNRALKEKNDLLNVVNDTKEQVASLEVEKQGLLQTLDKEKALTQKLNEQNTKLKKNLRAGVRKMTQTQRDLGQLNAEIATIKTENSTLKQEHDNLNSQLTQIIQERDNLLGKLSSVAELKKAIKEMKRQAHKIGREIKQKANPLTQEIIEGNRGFVIKDGKPTYRTRIKIEVMPAASIVEPPSQDK